MAKKRKGTEQQQQPQEPTEPIISPYTHFPMALRVGPERTEYYVPRHLFLKNSGRMVSSRTSPWSNEVDLPDIDECTGHVLAHYLHTGTYQTLDIAEPYLSKVDAEFKKAFVAYNTARTYQIPGLQQLAIYEMEKCGAAMTIYNILGAINDDFSKLTGDTRWFHGFLIGKFNAAFQDDFTVFATDDFFDQIDNIDLYKFAVKCAMELYSDQVTRMLHRDQRHREKSFHGVVKRTTKYSIEEARAKKNSIEEPVPVQVAVRGGHSPAGATSNSSSEDGGNDEDAGREEKEDDGLSEGSTASKNNDKQVKGEGEGEEKRKEAIEEAERNQEKDAAATAAITAGEGYSWVDQTSDASEENSWEAIKAAVSKGKKEVKAFEPALSPPVADPAMTFDVGSGWGSGEGSKTAPLGFDEGAKEERKKKDSAVSMGEPIPKSPPESKEQSHEAPPPFVLEAGPAKEQKKSKAIPIMPPVNKDPIVTEPAAVTRDPIVPEPAAVIKDPIVPESPPELAPLLPSDDNGSSSASTVSKNKGKEFPKETDFHIALEDLPPLPPLNTTFSPSISTTSTPTTTTTSTPKPYKKIRKPAKDTLLLAQPPQQPSFSRPPPQHPSAYRSSSSRPNSAFSSNGVGSSSGASGSSRDPWLQPAPLKKKDGSKKGGKKNRKDFPHPHAHPHPPFRPSNPYVRPGVAGENHGNAADWRELRRM
ncbi:hypothetical protein DM02DRAFT_675633 [Periconia macrospinosa]|uniref:BTB domain-containing protein n=1 Tax=Periconia macrospinosa TaxID=97972 RepID=A0A2V1DDJ5_9PLEO|nr:hypothetical protein DM02DRAFT_675633 [Periconia macrospinosa]